MSIITSLPVILVSAKTEATAAHFISELIDKEPPEASKAEEVGRVWRIENKYYTADVRLLAHADGEAPAAAGAVHGHVIYLAEDETDDQVSVTATARRSAAGAAAGVRVLACEGARLSPVLLAHAARARLEPVPLRAAPEAEGGVAAARAALQAHEWPGMRRQPAREAGPEDEAERWAAALGAVPAVRALPAGPARRAAAEALLHTFCRALGEDLHSL